MGQKGTETTFEERKQIASLHNQFKLAYQIARFVMRPRSKIQTIVDWFSAHKKIENTARRARPRALTLQDNRFVKSVKRKKIQ